MGESKENLENAQSSLSEYKSQEAGAGGGLEGGHHLEHINTIQNEVRIQYHIRLFYNVQHKTNLDRLISASS
jgi:hypothetical protein